MTRKFIICLLASLMIRIENARAQAVTGQVMRLQPTTLPATCNNGDLRVDINNAFLLNICSANAWGPVSPGVGGAAINLSNLSNVLVNTVIKPNANNAIALGASTAAWSSVFATTFVGALSGTASFANAAGTSSVTTAFASVPTACAAGVWANAIGANGNLTCSIVSTASTSGTAFFSATSGTASFTNAAQTASTAGTAAFAAVAGTASFATSSSTASTSGTAAFATSFNGTVAVANGGTGNSALSVSAGGVLFMDGSKVVNMGTGVVGQVVRSSGTGTPVWRTGSQTITTLSGSGNYTVPANSIWRSIRITGGGAGGCGTGLSVATFNGGLGGAGGNSTFSTVVAPGGSAPLNDTAFGCNAGNPVTATGTDFQVPGNRAATRNASGGTILGQPGGYGGSNPLGSGGPGGEEGGGTGSAGSGCGAGGGGGGSTTTSKYAPAGGGAGAYGEKVFIDTPGTVYAYSVGANGTAGTAGTSGVSGGAGSAGCIIIIEGLL